jgi:hypothetical protein
MNDVEIQYKLIVDLTDSENCSKAVYCEHSNKHPATTSTAEFVAGISDLSTRMTA